MIKVKILIKLHKKSDYFREFFKFEQYYHQKKKLKLYVSTGNKIFNIPWFLLQIDFLRTRILLHTWVYKNQPSILQNYIPWLLYKNINVCDAKVYYQGEKFNT